MVKLSTLKQDAKVLALRKKGFTFKEIGSILHLSVDQARHAERRKKVCRVAVERRCQK